MSQSPTKSLHPFEGPLNSAVNAAFNSAKSWCYLTLGLQLAVFAISVSSVFVTCISLSYPWIAIPVAVASLICASKSAEARGDAENLKRHLEGWTHFGEPISGRKLADFQQKTPKGLPPEVDALLTEGNRFASHQQPGAKRAAENISESAWFSHHLAKWCASALLWTLLCAGVGSVALLLYSTEKFAELSSRVYATKVVSAVLVFLMTGAAWKSWQSFGSFSGKAKEVDTAAAELASEDAPEEAAVRRLLTEYQLARAKAPLIPTWVWKLKQKSLNDGHQIFRTNKN